MARNPQKRPELLALVVADNFDARFAPFHGQQDWASKKIGGPFTALENCMLWLSRTCVTKVVVAVLNNDAEKVEKVKHEVMNFKSYFDWAVVSGENMMSVGDAIREAEQRGFVTGDFLLIHNVATFCSSTLETEIANFRERRKQDKNNCLTLIYTKSASEKNPIIGVGRNSKKLMYYYRKERMLEFDATLDFYLADAEIRRDLRDTGIALCGANIAAQFTDNFDFLERDDVIRELLVNEELLCQHIHVEVLSDDHEAAVVQDYATFLEIQNLILERWFYPIVPETQSIMSVGNRSPTYAEIRNLYINAKRKEYLFQRYGKITACRRDVFFDTGVVTGRNCVFECATIGENTEIGEGCTIRNCRIGKDVVIGNNVSLADSIIDDYVMIGNDCEFSPRTFIGEKVVIANGTKMVDEVRDGRVLVSERPEDEQDYAISEVDTYYQLRYKHRTGFWRNSNLERRRMRTMSNMDHVSHSERHSENEMPVAIHHTEDDRFLTEVYESIQQAYANIDSDEHKSSNLILEINSSKLAYNISMEKVAAGVMKSFMKLILERGLAVADAKKLIQKWLHVFKNYYGPHGNQVQLLLALEECGMQDALALKFTDHLVHFMFDDCEILNEEVILSFFEKLADNSPMKAKLKPIVEWLQEDSDEEESD